MDRELRDAFDSLMKQEGLAEHEMIACWLEFVAGRMRDLANEQTTK